MAGLRLGLERLGNHFLPGLGLEQAFDDERSPAFRPELTTHLSPTASAVWIIFICAWLESSTTITLPMPPAWRVTARCGTVTTFFLHSLHDLHTGEHARKKKTLRIRKLGAQGDHAGGLVRPEASDKRIFAGWVYSLPSSGISLAVPFSGADLVSPLWRGTVHRDQVGAGLREVEVDRIELLDGRHQRGLVFTDECASR